MDVKSLRSEFEKTHSVAGARLFSAPGRVNLIGEHTDYNDGFVLPIAINRRTTVAGASRPDRKVCVEALDLDESGEILLDQPREQKFKQSWLAYVEGVARLLEEDGGLRLKGADLAVSSEVPIGAGLSSSAALEISTGLALIALASAEFDSKKLALLAQKAEHVYAGANVGVMDQFTSVFGQKDKALLIDCRSLDIRFIDLNVDEYAIVVCNTNVKHELASSAYNERRSQCEQAVEILKQKLPGIRALRDVTSKQLAACGDVLPEVLLRRARHVITENERTLRAASTLEAGDAEKFGQLMFESHESLRTDYEVSCFELDTLVELASSCEGVAGSRMTGGGFGGSTVNLVQRNKVDSFRKLIQRKYQDRTGKEATIYIVSADNGASEVSDPSTSN